MVRGARRGGINKSHYLSSLMMQPPRPPPPLLSAQHHPLSQPISTRYPISDGRRLWIIESQGQCASLPITQWKMTLSWTYVCVCMCVCVSVCVCVGWRGWHGPAGVTPHWWTAMLPQRMHTLLPKMATHCDGWFVCLLCLSEGCVGAANYPSA